MRHLETKLKELQKQFKLHTDLNNKSRAEMSKDRIEKIQKQIKNLKK